MENKDSLGFYIAIIILLSLGAFILSLPLVAGLSMVARGALLVIFCFAIGLFVGWLAFSVMEHFGISSKGEIIGGIVIPLFFIFIMLISFFMVQAYSTKMAQESGIYGGYSIVGHPWYIETLSLFSHLNSGLIAITVFLYFIGFNLPIIKKVIKTNEKKELVWYGFGAVILIALYFAAYFIANMVVIWSLPIRQINL